MLLTANEKRVLRFIGSSLNVDYSINEIAKKCNVSPNGAYKILNKLENGGILKIKIIANIKSYKINFENDITKKILELAFMPDKLEGRVQLRFEDIKQLKAVTTACILFGSYITTKKKPNDLDILVVLEKKNFDSYKKSLSKVQDICPIKIQDIIQTTNDLIQNIKKQDPIVHEALKEGIFLWGAEKIVEAIEGAEG